MFNFQVNHKDASAPQDAFSLLPIGEYEVFALKKNKSGVNTVKAKRDGSVDEFVGQEYPWMEVVFVVRRDVEQKGKGTRIWHTFYFSPRSVGMTNQLFKALQIPDGTIIDSEEALVQEMLMTPVRVVINHEKYKRNDDSEGKKLVIKSFKKTQVDGYVDPDKHEKDLIEGYNNPSASIAPQAPRYNPYEDDGKPIDLQEDDLPF